MKLILTDDGDLCVVYAPKDLEVAYEYMTYLLDTSAITQETFHKCVSHLRYGKLPDNVIPFPDDTRH